MSYEMDSFKIKDAMGVEHEYRGALIGGTKGMVIVARIAELGAEPLAKLTQQALQVEGVLGALGTLAKQDRTEAEDAAAMAKLRAALPALHIDAAVREMKPLIASAPDLVPQILASTFRDGKPLSKTSEFDAAYAGNYLELGQAVWAVARANGFFPSLGTS